MFSDYKVINTPHSMNQTVLPTYNLPTSYQETTRIPNQIIPQGSNAFMYGYYNQLMLHPQVTISSKQTLNSFLPHHYQTLSPINTLSVHHNPTSQPYIVVNNNEELPTESKHLYSTAMFKRFIHNVLTYPKGNHYKATFEMNNAEELPADAMFKRFIHNVLNNPKEGLNAKNPNYYYL